MNTIREKERERERGRERERERERIKAPAVPIRSKIPFVKVGKENIHTVSKGVIQKLLYNSLGLEAIFEK